MEALEIEQTYTTPQVVFDPKKKYFKISGSTIPENVDVFYNPLLNWLDDYLKIAIPEKIEFVFDIRYFNASSSKKILGILHKLKRYTKRGGKVEISWLYCGDDSCVYEVGQDIACMLQMDFQFKGTSDCCMFKRIHSFSGN